MATTTEAVRRLTYKVDSDDAVRRLGQVQSAQKGVTGALNENTVASEANEARTARLQTRYQALLKQQQAMQAIIISQATATASATNQMAAANDNYARSTSHVGDALRTGAKAVLDYAASWAATAGAVGAAVLLFGRIVSVLTPIIITYKLFKTVVDSATLAWELGGKQLEDYRQIAEKAAAVDLSTTFYQRLIKGAEAAKVPVEDLTRLLQNLQKAAADALGGSALEQRLSKHLEAGNFGGNAGVQLLSQANTTQQRFEAVVTLINKAMQDGQRLAALDLAKTAFGPEVSDRLRQDSEYLDKILEQSKKIAETELVSAADIGRASELQARYDAAIKLLEQRWHPIQDLLTQLGVRMHTAWVGIVEAIAQAFDGAVRFVSKINEITPAFWDYVRRGANAAGTAVAAAGSTVPVIGAAVGIAGRLTAGATAQEEARATDAYTQALDRLRAGLQNTKGVQQAVNETATVANRVYGDNSKTLDKVTAAAAAQKDGFDRAIESAEKHIARMQADARAVGLGAAALEEGRTRAMLWTAALQAGIPVVGEVAQKIDELAKRAAEAAKELARARIDQNIKFQRDTIGLSSEDVQIAQQLSAVYPKVADALASVEAQQIRVTNAQGQLASGFREVGKEMFTAFATGKDVMDAMVRSLDALASKLANAGFDNLLSGIISLNPAQAALGAVQAGASALISAFTSDQKAAKEVEEARKRWEAMASQLEAFNRAADGFDLGTLTSELNSLHASMMQLALAALEAREFDDLLRVQEQFNRGAVRIVEEFKRGNEELSPFAAALRDLNNEARGLKESLEAIGLDALAAEIDATLPGLVQALRDQFSSDMTDRLNRSINSSRGQDYLNEVADAVADLGKNLADAALLGSDALAALADQEFILRAQSIVDAADLTGAAFDDLISKFPQLRDAVQEDAEERTRILQEALEAQKRQALDYKQYIDQLLGGPDAASSPIDRLNTTERAYREQLALARSGDTTAQQGLTGYFDRYREAAAGFYGTAGADYQRIIAGGVADLRGLSALLAPGLGLVSDNGSGIVSGTTPSTVTAGGGSAAPWGDLAALRAELTALREEVKGLREDANQRLDTSNKVAATAHVESQQVLTSIDTTLEEIRSGDLLESARPAA